MKHDHKKTSKLKVCLFTIVMLLPCLAVGITCLTHVFNKEVAEETETATINYKYETEQLQEFELLKNNHIYKIDFSQPTSITKLYAKYIKIIDSTNNQEIIQIEVDYTYNTTEESYITYNYDDQLVQIKTEFTDTTMDISDYTPRVIIYFVYSQYGATAEQVSMRNWNNEIEQCPTEYIPIESVTITTNPQDETTNIFYDSCEQVEDSFILNWCNNQNPIRTPIEQFTNAFSLPNNHIINTLITYWLCIAMIYIVIDIIVECVIMITHFFNKEF